MFPSDNVNNVAVASGGWHPLTGYSVSKLMISFNTKDGSKASRNTWQCVIEVYVAFLISPCASDIWIELILHVCCIFCFL